jgi:hypothetical protein
MGMTTRSCDGCGAEVSIAGGITTFWSGESDGTDGLLLELADGSDHFLCYDCIERLPDEREPTAEDVSELHS